MGISSESPTASDMYPADRVRGAIARLVGARTVVWTCGRYSAWLLNSPAQNLRSPNTVGTIRGTLPEFRVVSEGLSWAPTHPPHWRLKTRESEEAVFDCHSVSSCALADHEAPWLGD